MDDSGTHASDTPSGSSRRIALWLLACIFLFLAAMGIAMAGYPGGHGWSADVTGYDFWRNFWCDLLVPVTRTGARDNIYSMRFALLGMTAITAGAAPLWFSFGRLIPAMPRLAGCIRLTGMVSVAGIPAVALTAGQSLPHAASILTAALSSWLAALLAVFALTRQYPGSTVSRLGMAMLVLGAANFLLYVRERFLDGAMWVALPATQKLATIVMLLWLLNIAWLFLRQGSETRLQHSRTHR